MSDESSLPVQPAGPLGRIYTAVVLASQYIVYLAIVVMMIVVGAEVFMRYVIAQPLGWNISLLEHILMPGLVFLGLPWAYAISAHVAAGMVYDRLPGRARIALDWLTRLTIVFCAAFMIYAGVTVAFEAYRLGATPPPLSAQVPLPSWIWRSFLPLGTSMMLMLIIIDIARTTSRRRTS